MWYKLKRILIYPDGVTEKQVYPKGFSYDFRNKTQAQTEAAWWVVTTPYYTDANGWYATSGSGRLSKSINLTNAKKITIVAEMNIASNANALNIAVKNGSSSGTSWWIWAFASWNTSSNKWIWVQILSTWKWWDNYATISWATTLIYELDITNLKFYATIDNNWNNWTRTTTLTASDISTATTNPVIYIYSDSGNHRLKSINCLIE